MKSQTTVIAMRICLMLFMVFTCVLAATRPAHALTASGTQIKSTGVITYTDTNSNSYEGPSNEVIVQVTTVTAVSVTCAANQSTPTNVEVNYACTLTNDGNANNTFALSASSALGWSTTLYFDNDGDGTRDPEDTTVTASSGSIAAAAPYAFFVTVKPTAHTVDGTTSAFTLSITDGGSPAATASTSKTTTSEAPQLAVVKKVRNVEAGGGFLTEGVTAKPGQTLEYQLEIKNSGHFKGSSVVLTDPLDDNITHVAGSIWIGPDASAYNGAANANGKGGTGNFAVGSLANDDAWTCSGDLCGVAHYDSTASPKKVVFYLGDGAKEAPLTGGSLATGATLYVYHRATVK